MNEHGANSLGAGLEMRSSGESERVAEEDKECRKERDGTPAQGTESAFQLKLWHRCMEALRGPLRWLI